MADLCDRCAGWRYITITRYPTTFHRPCPGCNPDGSEPVAPEAPDWMKRMHDPNAWDSE